MYKLNRKALVSPWLLLSRAADFILEMRKGSFFTQQLSVHDGIWLFSAAINRPDYTARLSAELKSNKTAAELFCFL